MPITTANVLRGQTTQVLDEANEEIDTRKKKKFRSGKLMVLEIFTDLGVCGSVLPERERGGRRDRHSDRETERERGRQRTA